MAAPAPGPAARLQLLAEQGRRLRAGRRLEMSFCRWSSDNYKCDLYCYEDVAGGITTHVAGLRYVGDIPELPPIDKVPPSEYVKAFNKQIKALEKCPTVKIGLPYDAEFFNDPDYEAFLKRLLHLREVGYKFPDRVLDEIREIIANEVKNESA